MPRRHVLPNAPTLSAHPPRSYKVPYILPSSVYPNPFVFTLFSKLPGCASSHFQFSLFHFPVPLTPLECAVEHQTKDSSPACPVPDGEGVSRSKDLSRALSPLQC